jgi:hypothetical protein
VCPEWIDPETERQAWERAEGEVAYQQKLADEETEYQQLLSKQGERESQRNWDNYIEGDVMGFDVAGRAWALALIPARVSSLPCHSSGAWRSALSPS